MSIDITKGDNFSGQIENVYPSLNKRSRITLHLTYQRDFEPGLSVYGDGDIINMNEMIYDKIDTSDLVFNQKHILDVQIQMPPIMTLASTDDGSCI